MIQNVKNIAEEQLMEDMIEIYKPSREELSQMYKAIMNLLRAKSVSWAQSVQKDERGRISFTEDIKLSDVKIVWEILRTEM
jgi:hypothetical protein